MLLLVKYFNVTYLLIKHFPPSYEIAFRGSYFFLIIYLIKKKGEKRVINITFNWNKLKTLSQFFFPCKSGFFLKHKRDSLSEVLMAITLSKPICGLYVSDWLFLCVCVCFVHIFPWASISYLAFFLIIICFYFVYNSYTRFYLNNFASKMH